jgi:lysophospholipase L1-like esterase
VGWVSLLSREYLRRADVWNRGYNSGYNSQHALHVLPNAILVPEKQEILFATIFFGANDAALPGELQHVPPEEYRHNLAKIVEEMRSRLSPFSPKTNETKAKNNANNSEDHQSSCPSAGEYSNDLPNILFTPPPVDAEAWYKERGPPKNGQPVNDRANDNARRYGDIVQSIGKQVNCSVLDTFDLLGGDGPVEDYGKHLRDGLHLSESGNVLIYEGLPELLKDDYPHLLPMKDGQGKYGEVGIPLEGKLWRELC